MIPISDRQAHGDSGRRASCRYSPYVGLGVAHRGKIPAVRNTGIGIREAFADECYMR